MRPRPYAEQSHATASRMSKEEEVKILAGEIAEDLTTTKTRRPRKKVAVAPPAPTTEFVAGGVVVTVQHHLERVSKLIRRWEEGDFSTFDMALVLRRISRSIDNGATCWCEEKQCCGAHQKHVDPHLYCWH
jgi:hypothetical protein